MLTFAGWLSFGYIWTIFCSLSKFCCQLRLFMISVNCQSSYFPHGTTFTRERNVIKEFHWALSDIESTMETLVPFWHSLSSRRVSLVWSLSNCPSTHECFGHSLWAPSPHSRILLRTSFYYFLIDGVNNEINFKNVGRSDLSLSKELNISGEWKIDKVKVRCWLESVLLRWVGKLLLMKFGLVVALDEEILESRAKIIWF